MVSIALPRDYEKIQGAGLVWMKQYTFANKFAFIITKPGKRPNLNNWASFTNSFFVFPWSQ